MEAINARLKELEDFETNVYLERYAMFQRRSREDEDLQIRRQREDLEFRVALERRDDEEDVSAVCFWHKIENADDDILDITSRKTDTGPLIFAECDRYPPQG